MTHTDVHLLQARLKKPLSSFCILLAIILASILPLPSASLAQDTTDGIIWYPPIQLSSPSMEWASHQKIALSGDDTVHIVWLNEKLGLNEYHIPYRRSVDGGKTFDTLRNIFPSADSLASANNPLIVADHNDVYVFTNAYGTSPIQMFHSSNFGTEWSEPQSISNDYTGLLTWAAMLGDTIVIIYPKEPDLYRRILRSTDRGQTWTRTSRIMTEGMFEDYENRIALTPGTLHMVENLPVGNAAEVHYRRSTDVGSTWSTGVHLPTLDGWYSHIPTIAGYHSECGSELLVAWRDDKYGCIYCFLGTSVVSRTGLGNGDLWLHELALTEDWPDGTEPRAAIHGNARTVVWTAEINPPDTFYSAIRTAAGSLTQFSQKERLNLRVAPGNEVVISSHAIHVVWSEEVGINWQIFYRRGEFILPDAAISLATGLLEIDSTEVFKSSIDSITITNTGTDPLFVGTILADHPESFTAWPESVTVSPGESARVYVRYSPAELGTHTGKVLFYHNGESAPDCFTVTGRAVFSQYTTACERNKWTMVSLPLKPGPSKTLPNLYSYQGKYLSQSTMSFGKGYWTKPGDSVLSCTGYYTRRETLIVQKGWNIVGSVSEPLAVANIQSIPPGMIVSPCYGYSNSVEEYSETDTIHPGKGYWMKAYQSGKLILSTEEAGLLDRTDDGRKILVAGSFATVHIVPTVEPPPALPGTSIHHEGEQSNPTPHEFSLSQNYPNPFNPTTMISYSLPGIVGRDVVSTPSAEEGEAGRLSESSYKVTLKIYNTLGQEVAILVDGVKEPGRYQVRWDAEGLPAGVYYCRLHSGNYMETRTMILVK